MPNFKQSRGFKMKGFPTHTGVSPLRTEKKESMRAKDERVLLKAADKTKEGGEGATSYEEAEAVNLAKQRARATEIHGMSKREALKASGKKANLWNLVTKSKRKLKTKLRGKSTSDYYATKGTGIGQQAEQSDLRKDDKFTGVKEKSPTKQKNILRKDKKGVAKGANRAVQKMKLEKAKIKAIKRLKDSGQLTKEIENEIKKYVDL